MAISKRRKDRTGHWGAKKLSKHPVEMHPVSIDGELFQAERQKQIDDESTSSNRLRGCLAKLRQRW